MVKFLIQNGVDLESKVSSMKQFIVVRWSRFLLLQDYASITQANNFYPLKGTGVLANSYTLSSVKAPVLVPHIRISHTMNSIFSDFFQVSYNARNYSSHGEPFWHHIGFMAYKTLVNNLFKSCFDHFEELYKGR